MTSRSDSASPAGKPLTSLRPIANLCTSGGCPTVYQAGPTALVVQGYSIEPGHVGVDLAPGEALVEIPAALLAEALRNLG
jgi:hypothetical protein